MMSGMLLLNVDDDEVMVARCCIDQGDGGVFVTDESDKRTFPEWRRIGTLPDELRLTLVRRLNEKFTG